MHSIYGVLKFHGGNIQEKCPKSLLIRGEVMKKVRHTTINSWILFLDSILTINLYSLL